MRIVAIGDIGVADDMIHIGDEAMFEQLVIELRSRGVDEIIAISAAPDDTASRYGVTAISRMGFRTGSLADKTRRSELVVHAASGDTAQLDSDDPARAVIDAIRHADGVIIAGGGNLSSLWPEHIFERSTIGRLAEHFGTPLVVTGQTIGPMLEGDDIGRVKRLLATAKLVGLREPASFDLVRSWGIDATQTIDDASFLAFDSIAPDRPPYCLVSISSHVNGADRSAVVAALAGVLDGIRRTGLDVLFLAHFASLEGRSAGDTVMHDAVIAAMTEPAETIRTTDAATAALLARDAALVLTSRYHPAVFAASSGVPIIGIPVDDYTTVKLTGALGNVGQTGLLTVDELLGGAGPEFAAAVVANATATRVRAAELLPDLSSASAAWWNDVVAALS